MSAIHSSRTTGSGVDSIPKGGSCGSSQRREAKCDTGQQPPSPSIKTGREYSPFDGRSLWEGSSNEYQRADDSMRDDGEVQFPQLPEEWLTPEKHLIFRQPSLPSLSSLHPTAPQIFRLWQTFLNNVNPLVKIFHAPSVQQTILEVANNPKRASKATNSLMFAIYFSSVTSMSDQDCRSLMAEPKAVLLPRFSGVSQQALVKAEFLNSNSIVVLQALTLYILATSRLWNPQSLWLLTGLAKRVGQAIGLHREDRLHIPSPFKREMRRRLLWQILAMDSRAAQQLGAAIDPQFDLWWDVKRPLNVSDCQLFPSMSQPPTEYDGRTEMLFCLIRFEIEDGMRRLKFLVPDKATVQEVPSLTQQDRLIDELESRLENGLLKECDPFIPFHLFAIYVAQLSVCQMRLSVHHPRHRPDKGAALSQEDKDRLFELGLQIISYDNLINSDKRFQGYHWHVVLNIPFEALILVLTDLLTRREDTAVEQAWTQVNQVYEDHPELIAKSRNNSLYFAVGSLTLKAWDMMVNAVIQRQTSYQPVQPPCIALLRAQRASQNHN